MNFNKISDGNILRLLYFLFSFFLLDHPFLVHPSIILWLVLKIKINQFFGCFLQLAKLQRQNYFLELCIYILRVARFVFRFCLGHVTASAPTFLAITQFQWNFLDTFSSFLSRVGHRVGGWDVCQFFLFKVFFFLVYLALCPHLYCQEISLLLFSVQFLFSSCFLFLVFTL